jgi:hypothetical protein
MTTTETALNGKVHDLLLDQITRGTQIGAQVAAYRNGELIVDTWAGQIGPEDPRPVQPDTLFSSFSTTKGVAATALHILADRGVIDYGAPVAKYWPAFAANGKGNITVAQAMSHQAGLHAVPPGLNADLINDWDACLDYIANGTPGWEPGTATGYHALTYAWVAGGIVQHASGRHIKDVIQEEIAIPLGVEGQMYVGLPDSVPDERLATLSAFDRPAQQDNNPMAAPPDHDFFKAIPPRTARITTTAPSPSACRLRERPLLRPRHAKMYALANGGGSTASVSR